MRNLYFFSVRFVVKKLGKLQKFSKKKKFLSVKDYKEDRKKTSSYIFHIISLLVPLLSSTQIRVAKILKKKICVKWKRERVRCRVCEIFSIFILWCWWWCERISEKWKWTWTNIRMKGECMMHKGEKKKKCLKRVWIWIWIRIPFNFTMFSTFSLLVGRQSVTQWVPLRILVYSNEKQHTTRTNSIAEGRECVSFSFHFSSLILPSFFPTSTSFVVHKNDPTTNSTLKMSEHEHVFSHHLAALLLYGYIHNIANQHWVSEREKLFVCCSFAFKWDWVGLFFHFDIFLEFYSHCSSSSSSSFRFSEFQSQKLDIISYLVYIKFMECFCVCVC